MSLGALLTDALFRKRLSTVHARAALAGAVLVMTADDNGRPEFVLTRSPAMTHRFSQLADLEVFLFAIESQTEANDAS